MADDLSLLFRLRGENAQLKSTIADSRSAISSLRTSSTTDFKQIQSASTASFGNINQSLTQITGHIPVVGRAFNTLANQLNTVTTASGSASTGIASVVTPAGVAVVTVAALTAGVVLLGKGLFTLAQQSAEFQGKFFDLSQQVGVAVETLSTLDVIASTTGGSIETVTASLGIFQKNLEAAHDPTSKESKLLTELGVTSLETEAALRQTLKGLFDLGTGAKQTDAVLQLFGRGGRFVNAILKESEGNLDAATAKFQEMGLIVGGPAAAAADQFNDLLEIISRQLSTVSRQLVAETIPVFIVFFQDISTALTGNQNSWEAWADVIKIAAAEAIAAVESLVQYLASRGTLDFGILFETNVKSILDRASKLQGNLFIDSEIERLNRLGALAGSPGDRPDAGKAAATAQARAAKEIALAQKELENATRFHRQVLERERDLDLKTIDEWVEASITAASTHLAKQQEIFEQERENARRFIQNRQDRSLALREIDLKDERAQDDFQLAERQAKDEGNKRRAEAELNFERQLASIRDAAREGELARIKDDLDRKRITESEALTRELALLEDAQKQRLLLIDIELAQKTTSTARAVELTNERQEAEIRFTDAFKRLTQERIDAMAREQLEQNQRGQIRGTPLTDDQFATGAGAAANRQLGLPPAFTRDMIIAANAARDAFRGLGVAISETLGLSQSAGQAIGEALAGAFSQLASAVGSAVYAFTLFGTVEGGFKKFTAQLIASIAAQSAAQAVYEAAQGLAMLALTFFTGNPAYAASANAHFAAAAAFGAVAGAAVAIGRGVSSGGFGSAAGGGAGGSPGPPQALQTIDQGRNQPQRIVIQQAPVTVRLVSDLGELKKVIVANVVEDFKDGGDTREVINNDGR